MSTLTEDRLDHAGQTGAGANLEEGARTSGIHGLNLSDKVDRTSQLSGEYLAGFFSGLRIGLTRGVGINPGGRVAEPDFLQALAKGSAGSRDQGAVERRSDRELLIAQTLPIEELGGFFNFGGRSREDALFGRIAVRQHQLQA